jgi:hypothetical protein
MLLNGVTVEYLDADEGAIELVGSTPVPMNWRPGGLSLSLP